MADLFAPRNSTLTVLSFGGGQDSTALLELYLDDPVFRARYAPGDFLVVMSDTGDEFPDTYRHVRAMRAKCRAAGVGFVLITPDMGFHSASWLSLRHFYRTHATIGSKAYPKTCSDRLKIQPIYRFLEHWLSQRYGVQCRHKRGIREFAATYGKIRMMLGIAQGEEKRVSDPTKHPARWYRDSIEHAYPLIDLGMDRQACPFLSLEELEYLRRFHPESLADWVALEAAKLEKHRDKEATIVRDAEGEPVTRRDGTPKVQNRNYGVFGVTPLPVKIREAAERFREWSDAEVAAYRHSHGHCTATVF